MGVKRRIPSTGGEGAGRKYHGSVRPLSRRGEACRRADAFVSLSKTMAQ